MQHTKKDPQKRVLTIPNLLSLFRIILLPLFVWLYVFRQRYLAAAASVLILLSFVLYLRRNMQLLRGTGKDKQRSEHTEEKV